MTSNGNGSSDPQTFEKTFQQIVPLILEEWPQLTREDLLATEGKLEQAIHYISSQTEHTHALVRRYVNELVGLVQTNRSEDASTDAPNEARVGEVMSSKIDDLVTDLEARTEQLMQEFKAEVLPELERRARSNLGTSLLIALGIGFILGLSFGGKRG